MLTYTIVVNDNGEQKTISQAEIVRFAHSADASIEDTLNVILDRRATEADPIRLGLANFNKRHSSYPVTAAINTLLAMDSEALLDLRDAIREG